MPTVHRMRGAAISAAMVRNFARLFVAAAGLATSIATVYAATWVLNSSSGSPESAAAATARAATSARSADDPGAHRA